MVLSGTQIYSLKTVTSPSSQFFVPATKGGPYMLIYDDIGVAAG